MSENKKRLPRVGASQLDRARMMLKKVAEEDSVVDYEKIAKEYIQEENIELEEGTDIINYFFKSVLSKSPGGIYFPRKHSDKLSDKLLVACQESVYENISLSEISEDAEINLKWEDLFVGFDPNHKTRKHKKNKHKPIAEALDKKENISKTIIEMHNEFKRSPEIVNFINTVIADGVDGIEPEIRIDKFFVNYFLHTFKNLPRKKRLNEEEKIKRDEDIKSLFESGKTFDEIANIINKKYGSRQKGDSLRVMFYSRKLNTGKKYRKYVLKEIQDEVIDYISLKYGREGVSVDKVRDGLKSQLDFDIPKHGLIKIIKELELSKGKIEPTLEQRSWLREHAPSCLSQQELVEDFNKQFETNYEEDTIRKFDTAMAS